MTFIGSKPTQHSDTAELIGYAKRMVTQLNTNGMNDTPDDPAEVLAVVLAPVLSAQAPIAAKK